MRALHLPLDPGPDGPRLENRVPPVALTLSLLSLAVAATASFLWPESLEIYSALIWLLALIPSFLLAYYRGWGGAALGLLAAMGLLVAIEVLPDLLAGSAVDWRINGIVTVVLIAVSLGAGGVADSLRRQHAGALRMAYGDTLTGLPNRRMADYFLKQQFAAAQRGQLLTVVMFDIDHFKVYNDQFGHVAGDDVLRAFGAHLRDGIRRSDVAARYGGEEFIAILPMTDIQGGWTFADRVRSRVAEATFASGEGITVSGGVAQFDPAMKHPHQLVEAADIALYAAKAEGPNLVLRAEPQALSAEA